MKRKQVLLYSAFGLAFVGATFAMIPFGLSLKPSARAHAALPRIDVSALNTGTYKLVRHPTFAESQSGISSSILLLKKRDGEVKAWVVPTRKGAVLLPDLHWWRPMFECEDFGPTVSEGIVNEGAPIQCHDDYVPEWWSDKWQWSTDGKNYSGQVDNMEPAKGVIENGFFVVGKGI